MVAESRLNKMIKKKLSLAVLIKKELIAFSASCITIISLVVLAAFLSDWLYNIGNGVQRPAERGEDLGLGLLVVSLSLSSLFVSIPISIIIHCCIFEHVPRRKLK
jgi:hypothetical protein